MAHEASDHASPLQPGQGQARRPQLNGNGLSSKTTRRPPRAFDRPSSEALSSRRSSTISLDSFKESTNDMWLPRPKIRPGPSGDSSADGGSNWASAPLAFALLPAIGGMVFNNGSQVVSDILLLGLAAIFLNWSVRLPWDWYRSAQELRTQNAAMHDGLRDFSDGDISDSGLDEPAHTYPSGEPNFEVPTADEVKTATSKPSKPPHRPQSARKTRQIDTYEASKKELYSHELLALLCCFLFPPSGAYLLHTLRASLSRPSEGLVSNYNLTIFLLAAELRPTSHLVKLVQARTLHLQRVVKDNPYHSVDAQQSHDIAGIRAQLTALEGKFDGTPSQPPNDPSTKGATDDKTIALATTAIRKQLQPELDALNRAVRRYEKRAALQAMQTEARLHDLEARLGDALALAAAAAKAGQGWSPTAMLLEWVGRGVVLPWQVVGWVAQAPFGVFKSLLGVVGIGAGRVNPERDVRVKVDVGRRTRGQGRGRGVGEGMGKRGGRDAR